MLASAVLIGSLTGALGLATGIASAATGDDSATSVQNDYRGWSTSQGGMSAGAPKPIEMNITHGGNAATTKLPSLPFAMAGTIGDQGGKGQVPLYNRGSWLLPEKK